MEYQQERYGVIPQWQLMDEAKASLDGNWGLGAAAFFIAIIPSIIGEFGDLFNIVSHIIAAPITYGLAIFYLKISRDEEDVPLDVIFDGFKLFGKALGAYILIGIAVFIGMLCLIIPGIIIALGLSQTFFILADDPDMDVMDALKYSWELMDGHKADYFVLILRFFGWIFLGVITLFIGFFFVVPYMYTTFAKFYNSIRYGGHYYGPEDKEDDIINHLVD